VFFKQAQRLDAICGFGDDVEFRPELAELFTSCCRSVASSSATMAVAALNAVRTG